MSAYARLVESLLVEQRPDYSSATKVNQEEKPTGPVKSGTSDTTQTTQQDVEDRNKNNTTQQQDKIDPEQARKADALKSTGSGRGRQLGRIVRGAGDKGSLARGLARRYASSIEPGSRDKLSKVQSFKRGVDTISKGAVSGVKKALSFGRRTPTGGRSLV